MVCGAIRYNPYITAIEVVGAKGLRVYYTVIDFHDIPGRWYAVPYDTLVTQQ